jgi:transposase
VRCRCSKKSGGQEAQALGRSRGGFSTKIHIAVDALGNPLRFILTAGQCHDSPQTEALVEGYSTQALIADKGYDSKDLIEAVKAEGIQAVMPPRSNRREQRYYDKRLYKERHLVECFINKIKHYRRVFTRFEKLSKNYLGFPSFVSAFVWLR